MKKLLFLFCLLPVFCFAQTNFAPQFKRNIPADSLLGYSVPGITGNHWLPDTTWAKKMFALKISTSSILSGLGMSVSGSTLTVQPGTWQISNTVYSKGTSTNFTLHATDSTYYAYETVYATTSNTLGIVLGTFSLNPIEPAIPSGSIRVGAVLVAPYGYVVYGPLPSTAYIQANPLVLQNAYFYVRKGMADTLQVGNYTLPPRDGTSGQVPQTDGFGHVTWSSAAIYLPTYPVTLLNQHFGVDTSGTTRGLMTHTAFNDSLKANAATFNPKQFIISSKVVNLNPRDTTAIDSVLSMKGGRLYKGKAAAGGVAHANTGLHLSGDTVQMGGLIHLNTTLTLDTNKTFQILDGAGNNGLYMQQSATTGVFFGISGGNNDGTKSGQYRVDRNGIATITSINDTVDRSIQIDPTPTTGGMIVHDSEHKGLGADELFTVSGDPNQYVQAGNESNIYKNDGTITSPIRTVTLDTSLLVFKGKKGSQIIEHDWEYDYWSAVVQDTVSTLSSNFSGTAGQGEIGVGDSKYGYRSAIIDAEMVCCDVFGKRTPYIVLTTTDSASREKSVTLANYDGNDNGLRGIIFKDTRDTIGGMYVDTSYNRLGRRYNEWIPTWSAVKDRIDSAVSHSGAVPTSRTLTINGTTQDLSANRTWNVGTVTNIATGYGVLGGSITGTGTLTADTASSTGLVSKGRLASEMALKSPKLFIYAYDYNVPQYPIDGTTQIQAAINAALSGYTVINQKPKIWFAKGYYQATGLTNADKVDFIGEDAYFINGDIYAINRVMDNSNNVFQPKKSQTYINATYKLHPWLFIGDSITEGSDAPNFATQSYPSIIRTKFNSYYNNKSYGFENFNTNINFGSTTTYMTYTKVGFTSGTLFNGLFYGGIALSSVTAGDSVIITYTGKDAYLVYSQNAAASTLSVRQDGVLTGTIDCSLFGDTTQMPGINAYGAFSAPIIFSSWGTHTIVLKNTQNKTVTLCGMQFVGDYTAQAPLLNNVGRSSLKMTDLDANIIDYYCSTGSIVLSLGVNDNLFSSSISAFKTNYLRFLDDIKNNGGQIIVNDFIFNSPSSNAYKTILREYALQYNVPYNDFGALWIGNSFDNEKFNLLNVDGVHPTIQGHKFIANTILNEIDLDNTPQLTTTINNLPALNNQTANKIYAGPTTGSATIPTFRSLVTADLPTGIPNANLANSSITVQGTSVALGGSVNPINGTGFVKAAGTTISYDNSTYISTVNGATNQINSSASGNTVTLSLPDNLTQGGSSTATSITSSGSSSGTGGGASLWVRNGGNPIIIFGNQSNILGGSYNATPYIYANAAITISQPINVTGTISATSLTASKVVFTDASKNLTTTDPGILPIHGNSTTTGTGTTSVTVTIGSTMANTNYMVTIAPQDLLTAVNWYVSAKTTTTFTITFVSALTGSIDFDWSVLP